MTEPAAAADDVVRRWNPDGWARLHGTTPAPRVRVAAVPGSGEDELIGELEELCRETGGPDVEYVRDGSAAVVLLVLDASAFVGRTELSVLESAAQGAARVVCALTGIDRYPGWRGVLDADVALLQRHASLPEVAILPVAATAAARAREIGGDAGHVLRLESGIVDLHEMLRAATAAAHIGTVARSAVIARTRAVIAETVEGLRADDGAALRAERARLVQRTAAPADPAGRVRGDLQRARFELLQEVAAGVRATAAAVRDAVDTDPEQAPELLAAAVRALRDRVSAIVTARLGEPGTAPQRSPVPMPPATGTVEDRLTVVLGASAGAGLGRLLAFPLEAVPAAHVATVPITLVAGLGAAWWLVRVRRRIAARDRARRWVTDELTEIRAELDAWVLARVVDAEARAAATVAAEHTARVSALHDRIAALDEELRRRLGERNVRLEACRRDLASLDRPNRPRTGEPRVLPARPTL
ncbi:hypothetical protein [Rhodococcus phenolicus]|uniref:hypothetical protein n=1 Tax=Rhodococcus phenolicus TaxID=263849 RepID=UPI00082AA106|nr:hypothetical protein [Rhodococcus phenolicus]